MSNKPVLKSYQVSNLHDMLEYIELKPFLFLTDKSITALQNFLNGYLLFKPKERNHEQLIDFENFRLSLQSETDLHSKNNFFKFYFLEKADGDELKAFDMFFESLKYWKAS